MSRNKKSPNNMRLLTIGEKIKRDDEVNVQYGFGWSPIWKKVSCFIGWKVISYGQYRRKTN
mgnify:CR=1 FL=1|jgi:hypothetical protein